MKRNARIKDLNPHKIAARNLVAFAISIAPELKPYTGELIQYATSMATAIVAEGGQAIARYKFYKRGLLEYIYSEAIVERKLLKSKKFRCILVITDKLRADDLLNQKTISMLNTICRFYDYFEKGDRETQRDHDNFVTMYLSKTPSAFKPYKEYDDGSRFSYLTLLDDAKAIGFSEILGEVSVRTSDIPASLMKTGVIKLPQKYKPSFVDPKSKKEKKHKVSYAPSIIEAPLSIALQKQINLSDWGGPGMSYADFLMAFYQDLADLDKFTMDVSEYSSGPVDISEFQDCSLLRRVALFKQGGGKTRNICLGDYNTQNVLRFIHDAEFRLLAKLMSDYTRNQDLGFTRMAVLSKIRPVFCYDLSSATDALPIEIQMYLMEEIFGTNVAKKWYLLMRQIPTNEGFYSIGQPMGMYSSWATFTLTHHMIVWAAAKKAGIPNFRRNYHHYYGIVGDDIFICHPLLAQYYSQYMSALGVSINLQKSHISYPDGNTVTEFVKRNSYQGYEITAISPTLILKSFDHYDQLQQLITKCNKHFDDYQENIHDRLVRCIKLRGNSKFIRTSIHSLADYPITIGGLSVSQDLSGLDSRCVGTLVLITLYGMINMSIDRPFYSYTGVNYKDNFIRWTELDLPGSPVRSSDTPLNDLLRKTTIKESNSFVSDVIDKQQIVSFLHSIDFESMSQNDIKSLFTKVNSFSKHDFIFDKSIAKSKLERKSLRRARKALEWINEVDPTTAEFDQRKVDSLLLWGEKTVARLESLDSGSTYYDELKDLLPAVEETFYANLFAAMGETTEF